MPRRTPNVVIYCDMDQVLADFLGGAEKLIGEPFEAKSGDQHTQDEKKAMIVAKKGFWNNLSWHEGGRNLWKVITKNPNNTVHILSAYASWDPNCKPGKKAWLKKNLKPSPSRIYLVRRAEKQNFAEKNVILIDDHSRNIKEWSSAGGEAVLHINTSTTISKLKKLGII